MGELWEVWLPRNRHFDLTSVAGDAEQGDAVCASMRDKDTNGERRRKKEEMARIAFASEKEQEVRAKKRAAAKAAADRRKAYLSSSIDPSIGLIDGANRPI